MFGLLGAAEIGNAFSQYADPYYEARMRQYGAGMFGHASTMDLLREYAEAGRECVREKTFIEELKDEVDEWLKDTI